MEDKNNIIIKGELKITTESGLRISPRILELLKMIEKTGSLNTAVKKMGLSYSYCWNALYKINCQLKTSLVETQRGGTGGGLTVLTETGKNLIEQYDLLKKDFDQFLKEKTISL